MSNIRWFLCHRLKVIGPVPDLIVTLYRLKEDKLCVILDEEYIFVEPLSNHSTPQSEECVALSNTRPPNSSSSDKEAM